MYEKAGQIECIKDSERPKTNEQKREKLLPFHLLSDVQHTLIEQKELKKWEKDGRKGKVKIIGNK